MAQLTAAYKFGLDNIHEIQPDDRSWFEMKIVSSYQNDYFER